MFEKEAEERAKDYTDNARRQVAYECGFLDGVDFVKNKAKEWHKVVDGDLPSEDGGWVCNQDGLPCYFDWSTEQWLDCEGTQIRTTEWCHMPHKE